jgi:hypothetical protein
MATVGDASIALLFLVAAGISTAIVSAASKCTNSESEDMIALKETSDGELSSESVAEDEEMIEVLVSLTLSRLSNLVLSENS